MTIFGLTVIVLKVHATHASDPLVLLRQFLLIIVVVMLLLLLLLIGLLHIILLLLRAVLLFVVVLLRVVVLVVFLLLHIRVVVPRIVRFNGSRIHLMVIWYVLAVVVVVRIKAPVRVCESVPSSAH